MVKSSVSKEKTNYAKLVKIIILNNKTLLCLFQIAVIVGITFLFSITSLSETIIQTKAQNAIDTCGKFLLVIPNTDDALAEDIKKKKPTFQYKSFGIGGNIEYAGKKITYGAMNETMGDTLAFQVIAGTWPKDSKEISVEGYVANMFGIQSEDLPVSIPLRIDGQTTQYTVTGIISNYSYRLVDSCNRNTETKCYPSIIFNEGQLKQEHTSLVIMQKKLDLKTCSDDIDSILLDEYIKELDYDNICANDKLQSHGYDAMDDMIFMESVYRSLLNLILIFVFLILIRVIVTTTQKTLSIYEALGLSKKEKQLILFGLIGLILVIGMVIGGFCSFLFGFLYMNQALSDYGSYYFSALGKNIILEWIIVIVLLIGFSFAYSNGWNKSIINGLNSTYRGKKEMQKYKFKKLDFYVIIMQAVCLFFLIASMNFAETFRYQEEDLAYDLFSKEMEASIAVHGFHYVKESHEYFTYDDIELFRDLGDHAMLQMEAETKQSSILIDVQHTDEYWKEYCSKDNSEYRPEPGVIWNQISDEASKYNIMKPTPTQIIVLPQKEYLNFLQQNGINPDKLGNNQKNECILLLPEYPEELPDASMQKGGDILLGRIENINDQYTLLKESFRINEILSYSDNSSIVKIVITEDVAQKSKLILGYDKIYITMPGNTSQSMQKELEEKTSLLMSSVQGGKLFSSVARNEDNTLMDKYSSLLSNSLIVFSILSICLYILMNHYIEWETNKFEYGVLRSFGMSYRTLQHKLFVRYRNCTLIASVFALMFGYMAFQDGSIRIQHIIISLIIMFSVTFICRIIAYYLNEDTPICSMLNKK